ncbi:MAG: hypothetical protein LAO08_00670 [Acidobacteriia bacterium]|nr:hypothetical protein [Terriglobia bacterium]
MTISKSFLEHFRCAEEHAEFMAIGNGHTPPGFFRFGPDAICYGHVGTGFCSPSADAELYDASSDVRLENGSCMIAFEPDAVVENLRRERYVAEALPPGRGPSNGGFVRKAYYMVRPLLPVAVRKHLQRASLKGWANKPFPKWPVDRSVDSVFDQLMALAIAKQKAETIPFIWFWPEGKSGCAIMTHDIETRTGLDFCPTLMDLNDSCGIKSAFQVIPEGRYHAQKHELDTIRNRGFEVNVHDWNHDGHLYSSRELFLSRAAKINEVAAEYRAEGFRSGVLYRNTDWYGDLNFAYDMSVPNVGHLDPQPGGCCTVMPYFIGNMLEIPLTTIQDYSLFHILQDYSIEVWKRQIARILDGHGLATFNVHPDYVIEEKARAVYSQLLAYLASLESERNIWLALPRDLNRWWRDRSQMKIVERNGRLEIEGPGKERARIAYASMEGTRLSYTITGKTTYQEEPIRQTR